MFYLFAFLVWLALAALAAKLTDKLNYRYEDLPKWAWLRRIVLVFYYPYALVFTITACFRPWLGLRTWWHSFTHVMTWYTFLLRTPVVEN